MMIVAWSCGRSLQRTGLVQSLRGVNYPGGRWLSLATADLCDKYVESPGRVMVAQPGSLKDYGGVVSFSGRIETVRCFESNPLVRQTVESPGQDRVLVVDGGASMRVAVFGDQLASLAFQNNWAGVIVNGCIRDSAVVGTIPVGVKALGTNPLKSAKTHLGERGCTVAFAGVEFVPGHYVYADAVRRKMNEGTNPGCTHLLSLLFYSSPSFSLVVVVVVIVVVVSCCVGLMLDTRFRMGLSCPRLN